MNIAAESCLEEKMTSFEFWSPLVSGVLRMDLSAVAVNEAENLGR